MSKAAIAAIGAVLVVACIVSGVLIRAGAGTARTSALTPVAKFAATPTSGAVPLTVRFTDTSTGSPIAWMWNFGDGATSTDQNPSHMYRTAGKYTVKLLVTNSHGTNTLTRSDSITVNAPPPRAGWTTIIDDQFNTPGVPSHWLLYSGSYAGDATSCTAPSQVQVPGDGYLHLKMEYLTSGICGHGWYTGGMQIAKEYGGVDQAITVRWRIVPSADPRIVRSTRIIPMRWVDDPNYAWYQGEADYCEGSGLGGCYLYLHYGPSSQIVHGYPVDLTQWHTFRIEQRNHQVSLYIDNLTKPVWVYKGNATTVPGASMRAVLQQSCSLTMGCPSANYAGDVEDIQIDWITIESATDATSVSGNAQTGTGEVTSTQESAFARMARVGAVMATMPLARYDVPASEPRRRSPVSLEGSE